MKEGDLLRQVNPPYEPHYKKLMGSGLYGQLTGKGLLISHEEVDTGLAMSEGAIAVLKPDRIPFISYPYEWCFSQLKAAALATLEIQQSAIQLDMVLKDASAYNIQFHKGRPTLIDTLSFETYVPGTPWKAYKQFCQHFVAPLVLMSHVDVRLSKLTASFIDGIPLDLASKISKSATKFSPRVAMHLHLHAQMQAKAAHSTVPAQTRGAFNKNSLLGLIDSLQGLIEKLSWKPEGTEWGDYYSDTNYSSSSMSTKHQVVNEYLDLVTPQPAMVWDLGANNGEFSSLASARGIPTIAWDIDPAAVEKNYLKRSNDPYMLPLMQDLTNPSPAIGWNNKERDSFLQRGPADVVMALALIHHLAIGNNVPLADIATFMNDVGRWLIIEFVPKEDSQVQRLLSTREDVYPGYTQQGFEREFGQRFELVRATAIPDTRRTLYLMRGKG